MLKKFSSVKEAYGSIYRQNEMISNMFLKNFRIGTNIHKWEGNKTILANF